SRLDQGSGSRRASWPTSTRPRRGNTALSCRSAGRWPGRRPANCRSTEAGLRGPASLSYAFVSLLSHDKKPATGAGEKDQLAFTVLALVPAVVQIGIELQQAARALPKLGGGQRRNHLAPRIHGALSNPERFGNGLRAAVIGNRISFQHGNERLKHASGPCQGCFSGFRGIVAPHGDDGQ